MMSEDEMDRTTFAMLPPGQAVEEESEMLLSATAGPSNRKRGRYVVMLAAVFFVATAIGSVAIAKAWTPTAPAPQAKTVETLYDTESSDAATDFLSSRRLAQTITFNFDVKCAGDQPICNPEVVFASQMEKALNSMKKITPDLYEMLESSKLNRSQQEFIMGVLPLAKNMQVLQLGETIAKTIKQWEKSGSKVVHEKVNGVINQYLQSHGSKEHPTAASSQPTTGNSTLLLSHMGSELISFEKQNNNRRLGRQLYNSQLGDLVFYGLIVGGAITGVAVLLGILWLILEILNYTGVFEWGKWMKRVTMWINGIWGTIECLTLAACPFVFLSYWLDAWLLYGHNPSEMKGIPWDFMLKQLPGLNHGPKWEPNWMPFGGRRLLPADPRIAA